eukprot:7000638-Alexandrium_andersonii.AAC.1
MHRRTPESIRKAPESSGAFRKASGKLRGAPESTRKIPESPGELRRAFTGAAPAAGGQQQQQEL